VTVVSGASMGAAQGIFDLQGAFVTRAEAERSEIEIPSPSSISVRPTNSSQSV
jgi:hypothetical protein